MVIQITPKGNVLLSGPMTAHEEALLNSRLNAGPKTIAQAPKIKRDVTDRKRKGGNDVQ
tara:strand:+ start:299 stop:475 length:177 start_codon:yes stop_codon:yes gene_type:complete